MWALHARRLQAGLFPEPGGERLVPARTATPGATCGPDRSRCPAAATNQRAPPQGWTTGPPGPHRDTPDPAERLGSDAARTDAGVTAKRAGLPAPAATGEAAPTACCAAGGSGAIPLPTGRGRSLTAGKTGRSRKGRYLGNRRTGWFLMSPDGKQEVMQTLTHQLSDFLHIPWELEIK